MDIQKCFLGGSPAAELIAPNCILMDEVMVTTSMDHVGVKVDVNEIPLDINYSILKEV